jgi:hypothetical protein
MFTKSFAIASVMVSLPSVEVKTLDLSLFANEA